MWKISRWERFVPFILFVSLPIKVLGQAEMKADSVSLDSIVNTLPEVMVKGERPIAKVKGSTIEYDLAKLLGNRGVENVYESIKELPGVIERRQVYLSGQGGYGSLERANTHNVSGTVIQFTEVYTCFESFKGKCILFGTGKSSDKRSAYKYSVIR